MTSEHPNHSFPLTPKTTTNQGKWTWPLLAWTTVDLSEKRTQCVHTQGFTELAWPSLFFFASAFRPVWPGRCIWGLVCVPRPTLFFFVASAFRPVWPGRCIWGLVCVPRPTRTLDQGGVEPRPAVSLRPKGHRQYHYSTDAPMCTTSDSRPGPGGNRTAASCQPQAWRPSAIPLQHRRPSELAWPSHHGIDNRKDFFLLERHLGQVPWSLSVLSLSLFTTSRTRGESNRGYLSASGPKAIGNTATQQRRLNR